MAAGGPNAGGSANPAYQHSSSSTSLAASGSGHRSPFPYAPTSSSSQPSSSFAFARPMRSPSPKPLAKSLNGYSSSSADVSRFGEGLGRNNEDVSYGDDEDEIDSRSPSASHSSLPSAAKKIRRTHARRSCLACRKRKARCELPDITVPSSMETLPNTLKCHRCKTLDTDCVVWDGDRKMKGDRPARYGPPQDKLGAGKGRSAARTQVSVARSPLVDQADGIGESGTVRKKRKASPLITNPIRQADPLQLAMREPHLQDDYAQAVPNLRTIPIPAPTEEHCRARHWAVSTEDMIDTIGPWSDVEEDAGVRSATNGSSPLPSSKGSSLSGTLASTHATSGGGLLSKAAISASSLHQASFGATRGARAEASSTVTKGKPDAPGRKIVRDYRKKLLFATGRNAALMSEIIYGAPEYRIRARAGETVAYAYRGVPVVDEGTVPRDKVEALIRAHPFLNPELVNSVPEDADPASGRVFLSNVVNYLCLKPNPPPDLTSFVIRHSSIHVIMQSRNRETCQALLLLVLYEPSDMQLGKPAHDADVQLDHSPGHHLYQAAMNCALSLGLDRVIPNLSTGPDALKSHTSLQSRMSRLRDAALWLTVSSMGVGQAFASTRPQLPALFPSMADIDAFQDAIQPLLSASKKDNALLASVYQSTDTRPKSASASGPPHPPTTYQDLAMSLHILSQRARTSFQVRSYWNEMSLYNFSDSNNIVPIGSIIVSMTTDMLDTQLRNMSELETLQAQITKSSGSESASIDRRSNDPVLSILLKWAEVEALEIIAGLTVRVILAIVLEIAGRQRSLSKLGAYEGFDKLQPEQADMVAELGEWASWVNERLLRLASSLVALPPSDSADPRRSKPADSLDSSSATADYRTSSRYLHVIPHFHFCAAVFVAAKQSVEHKLFTSFGSGDLGSGNKTMLAVFGRAVQSLVTLAQQDRLSLPAIVANVLREFARRYANIVKKSEEVAEREQKANGSNKAKSGNKTEALNAGGAIGRAGETASSRFAARCANALEKIRKLFGDPAHWPPAPKSNRSAVDGRETQGEGRHASGAEGTPNSKVFEGTRTVSSASAQQQQQQHTLLPAFDALWGQQQQSRQQPPDYGFQMSMRTDNPQALSSTFDRSSNTEYDSGFSALSDSYFNDVWIGEQEQTVPFSFGDYTHSALDHLIGTLDDEFMGFPLETLLGKAAMGGEGSIVDSVVDHWQAGNPDHDASQELAIGSVQGNALPSEYSAEYPRGPSSATYTHNPVAAGPGPSPGASSSYSSDLSSAAMASGHSISRMISGSASLRHQPPPPQAQQHNSSSQHAPYVHHAYVRDQTHGRGPSSAGLYSPGGGTQGAYPFMGGHAAASAPPETAPLVSSYASFGDARVRSTHTPGAGPVAPESGPNGDVKFGPAVASYASRSDSGGYYAGSGGPGGSGSGGAGARQSPYPIAYGSVGGGAPLGGLPGGGGGFAQQQQHQHQHQHQQGYPHAASQQYQHQHQHQHHQQQQQQQQARHR